MIGLNFAELLPVVSNCKLEQTYQQSKTIKANHSHWLLENQKYVFLRNNVQPERVCRTMWYILKISETISTPKKKQKQKQEATELHSRPIKAQPTSKCKGAFAVHKHVMKETFEYYSNWPSTFQNIEYSKFPLLIGTPTMAQIQYQGNDISPAWG